MNRLQAGVIETLDRWEREAILNMANSMERTGARPFIVTYPTGNQRVRIEYVSRHTGLGEHKSYATPYLDPGFVQFDGFHFHYGEMECNLATYREKQAEWNLPELEG